LGHQADRLKRGARAARAPGSVRAPARRQTAKVSNKTSDKAAQESSDDSIALGALADNLGYRIRRAQLWVFREVSRRLAPFAMGPAQFSVLSIIDANPGINQLAIASALSIERAGLGRLVDRLEQQGLVVRTASSANRRYYVLGLTSAGAALLKRLRPHVAQCEKAIAEKIGSRAYQDLLQTLSIFLDE
jgi:DNA-binding MarR family transcriptional regulator